MLRSRGVGFLLVAVTALAALGAITWCRSLLRRDALADVYWQEPRLDLAEMGAHRRRMDHLGRAAARSRWHPAKGPEATPR